jgi:hypothetical protein
MAIHSKGRQQALQHWNIGDISRKSRFGRDIPFTLSLNWEMDPNNVNPELYTIGGQTQTNVSCHSGNLFPIGPLALAKNTSRRDEGRCRTFFDHDGI